jgi:hypothetical protein
MSRRANRAASTTYPGLADDVRPGDRILIDDGNVQLEMTGKTGTQVRTRVVVGGRPVSVPTRLPTTPGGRMATYSSLDIGYGPGEQEDGVSITDIRAAARARLADPAPADRSG